jgi:hypothetical protein
MTQSILKVYRYLNLLSIDVALGAACSALFFGKLLGVRILPVGLISLGLTVWIIYTVDHLQDARKVKANASTPRHRFHQQHFGVLRNTVLVAVIINAVIVFFVRKPVFYGGIVLVLVVLVYLLAHRFIRFPKEIFIAMLYTAGVLLPSVAVTTIGVRDWPWIIIIQFALIALLNLLMFSWFDAASDRRDGNTSFVTLAGERTSRLLIWTLLVISFFLTAFSRPVDAGVMMAGMNAVLLMIFANALFFSRAERFRLIGDAIFFIPLIYTLL